MNIHSLHDERWAQLRRTPLNHFLLALSIITVRVCSLILSIRRKKTSSRPLNSGINGFKFFPKCASGQGKRSRFMLLTWDQRWLAGIILTPNRSTNLTVISFLNTFSKTIIIGELFFNHWICNHIRRNDLVKADRQFNFLNNG